MLVLGMPLLGGHELGTVEARSGILSRIERHRHQLEVPLQLDLVPALHYDPLSTWRGEWVLSVFPN